MFNRVLTLGLIGIVLINGVASVVDNENNGLLVLLRPNDNQPNEMGPNGYVDENLDDLEPKPKIVDPESEYDPSLNAIFVTDNYVETTESYGIIGNRIGEGSEGGNFATEKPKPTEKVGAQPPEAPSGFICSLALCKKISEALTSARKEVDKTYVPFANAAKSMHEAKVKFLQSLPTAGFTFFRSLMERDEKS